MKITITRTLDHYYCDFCEQKVGGHLFCSICLKDICQDHRVYSGALDERFCTSCFAEHIKPYEDQLIELDIDCQYQMQQVSALFEKKRNYVREELRCRLIPVREFYTQHAGAR